MRLYKHLKSYWDSERINEVHANKWAKYNNAKEIWIKNGF
jgi:hypothetical protein